MYALFIQSTFYTYVAMIMRLWTRQLRHSSDLLHVWRLIWRKTVSDKWPAYEHNLIMSICWKSRATLFSGQWASRHQSYKLFCPKFAKVSTCNTSSSTGVLQNSGYFVGNEDNWQYCNDNRGIFYWQRFYQGHHIYIIRRKDIAAEDRSKYDAINFLRKRPKDKPFAMTVAFYPPKPVGENDKPGGQCFRRIQQSSCIRNWPYLIVYRIVMKNKSSDWLD